MGGAAVAPGANDTVSIGAPTPGVTRFVTGTGNSKSLAIAGSTVLSGQFATGTFTEANSTSVVLNTGSSLASNGDAWVGDSSSLSLNGGTMNVGGTFSNGYRGRESVSNNGSLTIGGDLVVQQSVVSIMSGGSVTVGGDFVDNYYATTVYVSGGSLTVNGLLTSKSNTIAAYDAGHVQLNGLQSFAGQGDVTLDVDTNSSIEIGSAGGAATGTITIDAGITVTEYGYFSAPRIVDNGILTVVDNAGLTLSGALKGSGQVRIGAGSTLNVYNIDPTSANTIAFTGSGGVLKIAASALDASKTFLPTITGFNASDAIDFSGTVTSTSYSAGVLTLFNGATAVARLNLAGDYTGQSFAANMVGGLAQISTTATFQWDPDPPVVTIANVGGLTNSTTQLISGTIDLADVGLQVAIYDGLSLLATVTPSQTTVWNANVTLSGDGPHNIFAQAVDSSGNVGKSTIVQYTLDTTVPAATTVALAHDTGSSATDKITSDPTLAVSGLEPGASLQYSTDNGATWGASFSPVSGANSIGVRQVDAAGNASPATTFAFTYDAAAAAPVLSLSNDTGIFGSDRITSDPSLALSGVEAGASVQYSQSGSSWQSTFTPFNARIRFRSGRSALPETCPHHPRHSRSPMMRPRLAHLWSGWPAIPDRRRATASPAPARST